MINWIKSLFECKCEKNVKANYRKLNNLEKSLVVIDRKSMTVKEIQAKWGISQSSVYRILKDAKR